MIKQNIVKDLFEEMEDKKFIEQADEVICDLFKLAKLYKGNEGYELALPFGLRIIEDKLRTYFKGMYNARVVELIREEMEEEENEELKLGGEA